MAFIFTLLMSFALCAVCHQFVFLNPLQSPALQVDGLGKAFVSGGRQLLRLNRELELEVTRNLTSDVVNISLSSEGGWFVVCLTDLSCEVYNMTNLSSQPILRRENAIISTESVALFAGEDSFYVGSFSTGALDQITLGQYKLNGNYTMNNYDVTLQNFERSFYNGFVQENNAYYFVVDNNPPVVRGIRVMRVCHNSNFSALHELTLGCGGLAPSFNTRIGGLSVVYNFAGSTEAAVILSRSRPGSSRNYVCLYSLPNIDSIMELKYNSCSAARAGTREQIDLAWKSDTRFCDGFLPTQNTCQFMTNIPLALDDVESLFYNGKFLIDLGQNYITSSVANVVASFSFVFVSFIDANGNSFIIGFNVGSTDRDIVLTESNAFNRKSIPYPVRQLQWPTGSQFVYAVSQASVTKIPIADCVSHPNCTSCLSSRNPLCGWCLLESKCSRREECQNVGIKWTQSNGTNSMECLTISVTPLSFLVDNPQVITLHLSTNLPVLLKNESYQCHFSNNETNFRVEAVGSGTIYTCNITDRIPMITQSIATVMFISLVSSTLGIPLATNASAFVIYNCKYASSCKVCIQTDNACGWCVYNKKCSGTSSVCINEDGGYLKINQSRNRNYADVCPLLDIQHFGQSYLQPVQVSRNIELVTRNLPPEISETFKYKCVINGAVLPAIYNSATSLSCVIQVGQLTLERGVGQQSVNITVRWRGNYQGQVIDHQIDHLNPVHVMLYSCAQLANCCSSCLYHVIEDGFDCGWCDRSTSNPSISNSCTYIGECNSAVLIRSGLDCPAPLITDFNPKTGPTQGGTTITITGQDLGVTYKDFTTNSISIGTDICSPIEDSFIPGKQILCTTLKGLPEAYAIVVMLPSGATASSAKFMFADPKIFGVEPVVGPWAGGTTLTVWGTNLGIGNRENTTISIANETECIIDQTNIEEDRIICITSLFTSGNFPMIGLVTIFIDQAVTTNSSVLFTYAPNPKFIQVNPSMTILAGGIKLTFSGTNLDVVQQPRFKVTDQQYLDTTNMTSCTVINSTAISCVTPPLSRLQPSDRDGLNYTIIMDNAPGPNLADKTLQIFVLPNPENFRLISTEIHQEINGSIKISGENLHSLPTNEIHVHIGGEPCVITAVDVHKGLLFCTPPSVLPGEITRATVTVCIGAHLKYTLADTLNYEMQESSNPQIILINSIVIPILLIFISVSMTIIIIIAVKRYKKIIKRKDHTSTVMTKSHYDTLIPMSSSPPTSSSQLTYRVPTQPPQVSQRLIIPGKHLHILNNKIGHGEFGVVYEAHLMRWHGHKRKKKVAVKTLKHLHTDSDREKMLAEINKMETLQHSNVMPLIGVCFDAGNVMSIVMPFMANGSLLSYLKKHRANIYLKGNSNLNNVMSVNKLLLRMCHQVAKGMEYLSAKGFVHRDLAARNCLLDSKGNVRVGDFGLAEDVYTRGYFRQDKNDVVKLPFKWMAPESLRDGLFSEKSDVWSFGITCWEIFSAGRIPYSAVNAISILILHEEGTRLDRPANAACSTEDYSIMVKCWALNPEDRPTFIQLRTDMDELLQTAAGYLELKMVLLPPKAEDNTDESGYEITENPFKNDFNDCLTVANPAAMSHDEKEIVAKSVTEDLTLRTLSLRASKPSTAAISDAVVISDAADSNHVDCGDYRDNKH